MNIEQQASNYRIMRHIERVRNLINLVVIDLLHRGERHDQSKMESPEAELFAKAKELSNLTYNSSEFNQEKKNLQQALDHHYANNRHHPEHFSRGIEDMNLLDILEMFCDWKASSELHNDGNLRKSIEINAERFGISIQLRRIMENTMEVLDR